MDKNTESALTTDDALRSLKKLSTRVRELLKLSELTRSQLYVEAAGMFLEISEKSKSSPAIDTDKADIIKVKNLNGLRKNYRVLRELFDTKNELEAMETKLTTSFAGKSQSPERALKELEKLKKEVVSGISEAFSFISNLAKGHLPEKLDKFSRGICLAVEKSLVYKDGRLFTYVFEEDGNIHFTVYLQLKHLEDDTGKVFPEIYLTMTYRTGLSPQMFVGVQHHFSPPSADLLMKKVKSIKEALISFNHLLELDSFSNTLGSLPLAVLLNPDSIVRDMFSYKDHVKAVEVNENEVVFHLRASALPLMDEITSQLFKELNSVRRKSNAKLRMAARKSKNGATVSFRFVSASNAPPVDSNDLGFLKDRFNMSDATLLKVVRMINTGE